MFYIKQNLENSIARYKAHLVAKGSHQQPGIDFHETFNPVANPIIIRIVLSIALNRQWGICQLDVNNVFLNGILWRRSIWHNRKACATLIIRIMYVVYIRLFTGSNKHPELGTRSLALSCSLLALSHPVQTCLSLFTPTVMHFSTSWSMLMI